MLRDSRRGQHLLISASQDAKAVVDAEMRVVDVNRAFRKSLGYARGEVLGRSALDFVGVADRAEAAKALSEALGGGNVPAVEVELIGKRGNRIFLFSPGVVPLTTDKGCKGYLISGMDITERKRAEEALRRSEERLRLIFEHSFDGISTREVDPKTFARRLVYCNDRYVAMSGRSRAELMKLYGVRKLLKHANTPEERSRQRKRLLSGLPCKGVDSWMRPDGKENYHEWVAVSVKLDGKLYIISINRDITDRVKAEEALRQSEERLRLILEHSNDGISFMELDPATGKRRLILCNDRFVEMSGRTRKELMAAEEIDALEGPGAPEGGTSQQEFVQHMLSGRPCRGTGSWIRPDGKENWIEWTAAPIRLGQKIYVVGIDRDITERRRVEEALRSANRLLMTAREEERRHLARELHDSVGQGLVGLHLAIQAAIGAVRDSLDSDRASRLEAASDKCGELIREVRHICHGLYPPTLESLGLVAALRQLAGYCRDAQVEAAVHCGKALSSARLPDSVEIALFRITQEAVSNSLRHGKARNIQLQLDYVAGEALLRIVDDGVGFDSIGASSAGLGLSTMRERASAVGGELKMESHPGRTCIKVRVPTLLRPGSSGATQGLANGQPVS